MGAFATDPGTGGCEGLLLALTVLTGRDRGNPISHQGLRAATPPPMPVLPHLLLVCLLISCSLVIFHQLIIREASRIFTSIFTGVA